ncbi:MAG: YbaK/prolyl-tRNA synthetase associated region [Frankiales bacterium]|jgi:prolyl-tRNA editing enzyme YbaK/EbsC (Cys-tRNA(Pro) deacylase)|nr:YbaK/prolyl-tRNA synthetase associated region [Frankiales bacterium]
MHPRTEQVAAELARAGAGGPVRELAESTRTAAEAAAALGCPVGAIANSLVFFADEEPVLVLTSGAHRVDTAHVAAQLGVSALRRAGAEEVRAVTGQPIGGVSPLGHPQPVRTLVDTALDAFPVVWAAAGTPHAVFPTTAEELRRLCAAQPVTVTAGDS